MKILILTIISISIVFANNMKINGKSLAKELSLSESLKASSQWKRIFKKEKKMKRYGIDKLTKEQKKLLQEYLVNHSADSDQPETAGI